MNEKKSFLTKIKEKLSLKKLVALGLVAIVAVAGLSAFLKRGASQQMSGFENVGTRTTVLRRTSLNDSVTVTGTVQSTQTVNVTCTVSGYTVDEILVQEGDYVTEGDVIARLDTTDLLENISKTKEKLADNAEAAQTTYDQAKSDMDKAYDNAIAQEKVLADAKAAQQAAKLNYEIAVNAVAAQQTAYDSAAAELTVANNINNQNITAMNNKKAAMDSAFSAQETAKTAYNNAVADGAENTDELYAALTAAQVRYEAATAEYSTAQKAVTASTEKYNAAKTAESSALAALNQAKSDTNYTALETEYNRAQQTYSRARSTLDNLQKTYSNAVSSFEKAEDALENATTSDELEELYEKYNNCTITANATGTITQVNTTVGSVANGTIAVIQDTENLKISTSFAEYDVQNIELGMRCIITSDANDKTLSGYVSQISPVASGGNMGSSDVSFAAEVTISGTDHGLLIGMNAQAEVIITQVSDVYVVPYDAVGTNENGEKVVYVQDGEDFKSVVVETGMETDYYIEISSSELSEGMVIRSSANEDESDSVVFTEDGEAAEQGGFNMAGFGNLTGNGGGGMPSGGGNMPSGGGNMPSGDRGGMGGRG